MSQRLVNPSATKKEILAGNSILGKKVVGLLNKGYHQRYALSIEGLKEKPKKPLKK